MKTNQIVFFALLITLITGMLPILAQNEVKEQLTIPLSDPNKTGWLKIGIITGDIHVIGYTGKQVLVDVVSPGAKDDQKKDANANGMRKLSSNGGLQITAEEEKNVVEIKAGNPNRKIDLNIKVPQQFSLKLSTINDGDISVENVNGEMEISNINGPILLNNISGSAVANTINGDLKADFKTTTANAPMAFSTLNGKIDVTFPASAKFDAKFKSDRGDIYSDFDIDIEKGKPQANNSGKDGMYKVTIEDWVKGKVNGGGSEVMMKNMNGNIYIRKAK